MELSAKHEDAVDYDGQEEVKAVDDDDLPLKLSKVDHVRIFKCIAELIGLIKAQFPELSLRLFLQGAEAINRLNNY